MESRVRTIIFELLIIILIASIIGLQDYILIKKLRSERTSQLTELEQKVKFLQSRVNANSELITTYAPGDSRSTN